MSAHCACRQFLLKSLSCQNISVDRLFTLQHLEQQCLEQCLEQGPGGQEVDQGPWGPGQQELAQGPGEQQVVQGPGGPGEQELAHGPGELELVTQPASIFLQPVLWRLSSQQLKYRISILGKKLGESFYRKILYV